MMRSFVSIIVVLSSTKGRITSHDSMSFLMTGGIIRKTQIVYQV